MPNLPNLSDCHRNQFLSDFLLAYTPAAGIANQIFPSRPVDKQTNQYPVINQDDWFRRPNTLRSPGAPPNYVNFSVSSDQYQCVNYALGHEVWFEVQDNADRPLNPKQDGAEFLKDQLFIDYECRVENKCATGVGSSMGLTGTDAWNDYPGSDPINNIQVAREAIRSTTGLTPNVAIIPEKVMLKLKHHPEMVRAAYAGGAGGGMVGEAQLRDIFGVDRLLVPKMIRNTAAKGGTAAYTDVWSTNTYLLHVQPTGLKVATFGVSFYWVGENIGRNQPTNFIVYEKDDSELQTTKMWTGYHQDEKVCAPALGFQIRTGITA